MDFKTIGLSQELIDALAIESITVPTSAQEKAIPILLENKDLILQSQTGSGKTLAYLLPIYQQQKDPIEKGAQVMIVVPTRELAMQVHHQVEEFSKNSNILLRSAVLFGHVNINKQVEKLREKPQIIIGTSDRILELIKMKKLPAHTVKTLIIDEADKLFDKQSIDGLKAVRKALMRDIQMVFVSATFPRKGIEEIKVMAPNCQLIKTEVKHQIPTNITHMHLRCDERDKLDILRKMINVIKPEKTIVFINELDDINIAVTKLKYNGLDCACIHSGSSKQERQKRLQDFTNGNLNVLVATDLAARGLHVDDVTCVFNVSIAEDPTDYLHRAGRTGRNGTPGISICLVAQNEEIFLDKYKDKFHIKMQRIRMRNGEIIAIHPDNSYTLLF